MLTAWTAHKQRTLPVFRIQLSTSQNWSSLTPSAIFSCWGLSGEWFLCWEMRWSPASCERALRCLSGISQAGQRNLNLERVVSTNISPSGYIKPKFVVLSSFNISCCQERVSGTKLETTYYPLKTLRNRQILLKNESIDDFDSIVALLSLNKYYHLPLTG